MYLAAVRERMIEVAGEVADGLLVHPLQSPRFLDEVVRPALDRGLERAGRGRDEVSISVAQLAATTPDELEACAGGWRSTAPPPATARCSICTG